MVTQNYFAIPAMILEKLRSQGFPEGVTLTADHCIIQFQLISAHVNTYAIKNKKMKYNFDKTFRLNF